MRILLIALFLVLCNNVLDAQWTTSGNNIYNSNTGNVGIGTTNPSQKLQVNGNVDVTQFNFFRSSRIYLQAANSTANGNNRGVISNNIIWDSAANVWKLTQGTTSPDFAMIRYQVSGAIGFFNAPISQTDTLFSNDALEAFRRMTIFNNGNVGIGTNDTKGYKLAVNGDGIFNKVVVQTYPWPDYVFEPNYQLPTLQSVEAYIREHRHLPGVPTAGNIAKTGVDIGGTQAILLQKIEELTLYIINQNRVLETANETGKKQQMQLSEQAAEIRSLKQSLADVQALLKELLTQINKEQ